MKSASNSYIKSFIPFTALLTGIVLFSVLAVLPKFRELEQLRGELREVNREIEEASAIAASTPEMRAEIQRLEERYEALRQRIPRDASIPRIVSRISEELDRPGVRLISLSPEAVPPENGGGGVVVRLNMRTGYISLGEIMRGFEESDMLFAVSDFRVRTTPAENELDTDLTLKSFFRD